MNPLVFPSERSSAPGSQRRSTGDGAPQRSRRARRYEVGYKRPPKSGQFKPGQSGNPSGRHPAPRTPPEIIDHTLNRMVTVTIDGRRRKMTTFHAFWMQLMEAAARGDARARRDLLEFAVKFGYDPSEPSPFPYLDDIDGVERTPEKQSEVYMFLAGYCLIKALAEMGRMARDTDGLFSVHPDILLDIFGSHLSRAEWAAVERHLRLGKVTIEPA